MGLRQNILREPISSLSLRRCPTTTADVTVLQAVQIMRRDALGAIIIVNDDGKPLGMFNEHMLTRLLSENPASLKDPISRHMTNYVVCLRRDEPIAKLIATMFERDLRWVCIVNKDGRPVSFSGLRGVVEYVAEYFPHSVLVQPTTTPNVALRSREGA